jgi:hypothetical protein
MEEQSIDESEVHKAKERFRTELARVKKFSLNAMDPAEIERLANLPPHLQQH